LYGLVDFLTFLRLKNLWWDIKSKFLRTFFYVCRESQGLEDGKFSYEGQNFILPYISIWYFFWLQIARWPQKCTYFVVWRSTLNLQDEIDRNLVKFENFIYFDHIWPPVVENDLQATKHAHFWNKRTIYNQKKYHIVRYIGQLKILTFIWEISIFKASGFPTDLKKSTQKLFLFWLQLFNGQTRSISTKLKKKLTLLLKNLQYAAEAFAP
jgi:hypothetical protein